MSRSRRSGIHCQGPLYGNNRSMGGALLDLPIGIAAQADTIVWFNDFLRGEADYDDTADWTESVIGAGTGASVAIATDTAAGVLVVNAGTADDEGIQTEFTGASGAGEFIVPADDKWFAYGARFKKDDADKGAIWVGIGETLTTTPLLVATDGLLTNLVDGIGFWTGESSATLSLKAVRSSGTKTGSATILTMADDTYVDVAFRCHVGDISSNTLNGTTIPYAKVNGVWKQVGTPFTAAIPNAGVCLQFAAKNEPAGTTHDTDLTIDYVWVAIER